MNCELPRAAKRRRQIRLDGGYDMVPAYTTEEVLAILAERHARAAARRAAAYRAGVAAAVKPCINPMCACRGGPCAECPDGQTTAATRDVLAERQRQISVEGWHAKHDDEHEDGSLALAAACYASNAATWIQSGRFVPRADYTKLSPGARWPWLAKWWKPKNERQDLVRAGALILAEIERLDRRAA